MFRTAEAGKTLATVAGAVKKKCVRAAIFPGILILIGFSAGDCQGIPL